MLYGKSRKAAPRSRSGAAGFERLFLVALLAGASACESSGTGGGGSSLQAVPEASPAPSPTVTALPSPRPSSSPSPAPSPSPSATPSPGGLYTGPASVEKYVLKFVDDAKIQGFDVLPEMKNPTLQIRIASLDSYGSSVIGLCETSGIRRVTFDPDFWNTVSETQREILAHHELGHCVLYRGHRSAKLASGAYASVMYPIIMSSATYTGNYDYYQDELFNWGAIGGDIVDPELPVTHICGQEELP